MATSLMKYRNITKLTTWTICLIAAMMIAPAAVDAAVSQSANYKMPRHAFGSGGAGIFSSSYKANSSIGQSVSGGISRSESYGMIASFQPNTPIDTTVDTDADGVANFLDADDDNDGVADGPDNCPILANANQRDTDSDGAGDVCDADDDNDGIADASDNCPLVINVGQEDNESDGVGDLCDADDDNDGMPDAFETAKGFDPLDPADALQDADGDGFTNLEEFEAGTDPNDPESVPGPKSVLVST